MLSACLVVLHFLPPEKQPVCLWINLASSSPPWHYCSSTERETEVSRVSRAPLRFVPSTHTNLTQSSLKLTVQKWLKMGFCKMVSVIKNFFLLSIVCSLV